MPTDLATIDPHGLPAELAALSTAELRAELARSLSLTAAHLTRLALIVRALEERGEDLSDLKIGLLGYLRRIAHGQVVPELVVRYAESPALMRTLSALPLPDQARIAAGEPVPMVVRKDGGGFDRRMVDPLKMTRGQVSQVFGRGQIRDEAEQINLLEDRGPTPVAQERGTPRRGTIRADRNRGGLVVGKKFLPSGDVVSALAELQGDVDAAPADVGVGVKLTEAEHVALKNAATRSGVSMNVLVRRALMLAGLFAGE